MRKTVRGVLATLAASAALAGCMAMGAQEKEGQLAAAGFVRQQADTPEKMAKLQSLPQNTMVFSQRKRRAALHHAMLRVAIALSSATPPPISNIRRSAPPTTSRRCKRRPRC